MSVDTRGPALYHVTYSGRVRQRIIELAAEATARGDGEEFLAALVEIDRRLKVYPQFGDSLADLMIADGQVRLGAVSPLSMRYGVLESRREVLVTALAVLLSKLAGGDAKPRSV